MSPEQMEAQIFALRTGLQALGEKLASGGGGGSSAPRDDSGLRDLTTRFEQLCQRVEEINQRVEAALAQLNTPNIEPAAEEPDDDEPEPPHRRRRK